MSSETKGHRHDVGDPAHGAESQEGVTKALQVLLGMCIAGTAALVIFAIYHAIK